MTGTEPVGLREIAQRLGVKRETANMWHHRGILPPHEWIVSGHPAWRWSVIEKWAKETGRLG